MASLHAVVSRPWGLALAVVLLGLAVLVATCAGPDRALYPPEPNEPTRTVYVVRHEWHAGIVVRRADIPRGVWPQHSDFAGNRHLEVGWGDQDFYQAREPTLGLAAKAVLWPTPSVLHIVGFDAPVSEYFPHSEIVEITLSVSGFERLCTYIESAYAIDSQGNPVRLGRGLYGNSQFYSSGQRYSLFKTCNVWTSKALRAAGCPITPAYAVSVTNLMYQVRKFGRVVRPVS